MQEEVNPTPKSNQDKLVAPNDVNPTPPLSPSMPSRSSHVPMLILLIFVVMLVVIGYLALHKSTTKSPGTIPSSIASAPPASVEVTATGFSPQSITVKVNQAVIWTNDDSVSHKIASDPFPNDNGLVGFKEAGTLAHGDSYSFVFNKAGTFTYHDDLHPYNYHGTVIVKAPVNQSSPNKRKSY